jgi:hypothetical protein
MPPGIGPLAREKPKLTTTMIHQTAGGHIIARYPTEGLTSPSEVDNENRYRHALWYPGERPGSHPVGYSLQKTA